MGIRGQHPGKLMNRMGNALQMDHTRMQKNGLSKLRLKLKCRRRKQALPPILCRPHFPMTV